MSRKPKPTTFAQRLAAAMESHHAGPLSVQRLREELAARGYDVGERAVQYWIVGPSTPPLHRIDVVCTVLGVTADYLVRGRS